MRADFEGGLKPLWLRGLRGDEGAYRQALGMLSQRLRGYFRSRLASLPDEVEDLVQETLLALHLQRATYDPSLPVSAWAHAIARHKLVDLWRRRGRRPEVSLDELDESGGLDELAADEPREQSARRDLDVLLQSLPAAQRDAILLIKVEGLTVAEASARTGVSVSALKVQVHRGLKRLAALIRSDAS
jgi:RNA polymerase sigma-70 factor, ECF subfamily